MVKEIWQLELVPGGGGKRWAEVADWLKRMAQALKKQDLVIDACGLRNENGDAKTLQTAYLTIDFESMEKRRAFYPDKFNEAVGTMQKENEEKQYVTDNVGHYYFDVYQ